MTTEEMIAALEISKHDHYDGGQEGLDACEAIEWTCEQGYRYHEEKCSCGATEANQRINAVIQEINRRDDANRT